jgi:predicted nucleic acid-binding protein
VSALLDTSVLVGVEQGRVRREDVPPDAAVSAVTLEELRLGVLRSLGAARARRQRTFSSISSLYDVLVVDARVATTCAEIRAEGRDRGVRYAPFDSLIGATARVHGLPLYTRDAGMLGMAGVDVRVVG